MIKQNYMTEIYQGVFGLIPEEPKMPTISPRQEETASLISTILTL